MSATTVAVHVPAWKRLGLKLKKTPDADDNSSDPEVPAAAKGSKRQKKEERRARAAADQAEGAEDADGEGRDRAADGQAGEGRSKKKKRRSKDRKPESPEPVPEPVSESVPTATAATAAKPLLLRHPRAPPALRKSVTFSADTKATDGDSIKTLYQNHDPFAHYDSYQQHLANYPSAPAPAPTNELPAGFDDPPPAVEVKHKYGSTGKRKKFSDDDDGEDAASTAASTKDTTKDTTKDSTPAPPPPPQKKHKQTPPHDPAPYITYLTAHHAHRAAWRFEKAKQNWLLRHAFDTAQIPAAHDAALRAYLASVQGAAARDRLLAAANEVVKRRADTIGRDGERVDAALQRAGVARARLVLGALGHGEEEEDDEGGSGGGGGSDGSDSSDSGDSEE